MLSYLLELAREPSSEKRRELLGQLAEMFYKPGRDALAEQQLQMFATVVTRLLRDVDEPARAEFSDRIAGEAKTPKALALSLARDTARVAQPVLERSPALDDNDLVEIAYDGPQQRLAISRRETVTERVTDALISFDELDVMQSLLGSSGAAISENGFERIAVRADGKNGLREKICLRGDVPVALATKLMPHLSDADRAKMQRLIEANDIQISYIVRDALPMVSYDRVNRAKRRLQIKAFATMVWEERLTIDGFVDDLLSSHVALDVALGFAELSNLSEKHVANAILSISPEPLALIAKALGLGAETYARLDELRRDEMRLPRDMAGALLKSYAALDTEQARRALRFVQVRANIAAAG